MAVAKVEGRRAKVERLREQAAMAWEAWQGDPSSAEKRRHYFDVDAELSAAKRAYREVFTPPIITGPPSVDPVTTDPVKKAKVSQTGFPCSFVGCSVIAKTKHGRARHEAAHR